MLLKYNFPLFEMKMKTKRVTSTKRLKGLSFINEHKEILLIEKGGPLCKIQYLP